MFTPALITCCKQTPFNKSPAGQKWFSIFRGYLRIFLFPCRKHPTILEQKWANLENDIRKHNLEVVPIQANGYCFLNSILTCLLWDYSDTLTLEDCITKIVTHLCQNHRKWCLSSNFVYQICCWSVNIWCFRFLPEWTIPCWCSQSSHANHSWWAQFGTVHLPKKCWFDPGTSF